MDGVPKLNPVDVVEGLPNPPKPANLDGAASLDVLVLVIGPPVPKVKEVVGVVDVEDEPKLKRDLGFSVSPVLSLSLSLAPKEKSGFLVVVLPLKGRGEDEEDEVDVSFFSSEGLVPKKDGVGVVVSFFSSEGLEPNVNGREDSGVSDFLEVSEGVPKVNPAAEGLDSIGFDSVGLPKVKPPAGGVNEGVKPPLAVSLVVALVSVGNEDFPPPNVNPPAGGAGMEEVFVTGAGADVGADGVAEAVEVDAGCDAFVSKSF